MVKGTASEVVEQVVPTPAGAPSEAAPVEETAQVGAEATAEEPAPVAQEQKPDVKALWSELPPEERQALVQEEDWHKEALRRAEFEAERKIQSRTQADEHRRMRANQDLQVTLQNLDNTVDDSQRAQHIQGYAQSYAEGVAAQVGQQWTEFLDSSYRQVFGLNDAQYRNAWDDVKRKVARENRTANYSDFLAHMTGEKFMPKGNLSKDIQEEINARVEEALGKRLAGQPSPVTLGPGESLSDGTFTRSQLNAMSPAEYAAKEEKIMAAMWANKIKDE